MTERNITARLKRKAILPLTALILLVSGFGLVGFVYGYINEAISLALEAATPYVEQGFEVREDNWSGEVEPGKDLLVRHQLFRGNEYWFWGGTSWSGATVKVAIFDNKGMAVGLESFSKEGKAGVRVLPSKTGTYFVRVKVDFKKDDKAAGTISQEEKPKSLDWGLVYGYR